MIKTKWVLRAYLANGEELLKVVSLHADAKKGGGPKGCS